MDQMKLERIKYIEQWLKDNAGTVSSKVAHYTGELVKLRAVLQKDAPERSSHTKEPRPSIKLTTEHIPLVAHSFSTMSEQRGNLLMTFNHPNFSLLACREWIPSLGFIGDKFGFDTETEPIKDDSHIPNLVLSIAYPGNGSIYFITPGNMAAFMEVHAKSLFIGHNLVFDINVIEQTTQRSLSEQIQQGLFRDTGILYRLVMLATKGYVPQWWSLDSATLELLDIELSKDENIRLKFGQFIGNDGSVELKSIPRSFLEYAGLDTVVTLALHDFLHESLLNVCEEHGVEPNLLLSHDDQLRAAIALDRVSRNGMHIDQKAIACLKLELDKELSELKQTLQENYAYQSGEGSAKKYQELMQGIETELGVELSRTKTGRITGKEEDLEVCEGHPFVDAYLRLKELEKLLSTFVSKLNTLPVVFPQYTLLVRSGRVSCHGPNIQQMPRKSGVREAFIPSPGYYFLGIDFDTIELRALAQITYGMFGYSIMRDTINSGVDLHRATAAAITGKATEDVSDDERTLAKALNFGLAGGLGAASFSKFAKLNYGLDIDEDKARELKEDWLNAYPEMREYMASTNTLAERYELDRNPSGWSMEYMPAVFRKILLGNPCSSNGNPYPEILVDWVWGTVATAEFNGREKFEDAIRNREGSEKLLRAAMSFQTVVLPSGMIRANCSYCQKLNGPFQGLVAWGAKRALWNLHKAGFRVTAFIHDEVLVELPIDADHLVLARQVQKIMIGSMSTVIPDVKINAGFALMDRWHKKAKPIYDNPNNPTRLLVWQPQK